MKFSNDFGVYPCSLAQIDAVIGQTKIDGSKFEREWTIQ
jgi:hypothetical protein